MTVETHIIRKGFDIRLDGAPPPGIEPVDRPGPAALCVEGIPGLRPRLRVREGDRVRRGAVIAQDKRIDGLRLRAPAGGRVRSIVFGKRRALRWVEIETGDAEGGEERVEPAAGAEADRVRDCLLGGGGWVFLRRRPYSRIADPGVPPKALFVNAMNTAPFRIDPESAVRGREEEFAAGLAGLGRLSRGPVRVCCGPEHQAFFEPLCGAAGVALHVFRGPHPAGLSSVHIHELDAISPGETVWTAAAADVVRIGALLRDGILPADRVVALGGPGLRPGSRGHVRIAEGASLARLFEGRLAPGEQRVIQGDALSGAAADPGGFLSLGATSFTVLPEGGGRDFLGWLRPGLGAFSHSRLFLSTWLRPRARWAHTTRRHGAARAMVATGLYDRFLPMRILPDALVRAVLADDLDEAVRLGLLEVDPEDFALPAFACPSKMDLVGIIRRGLDAAEAEGV